MSRQFRILCVVLFGVAVWSACSGSQADKQSAAASIPLEKIQGKAQKLIEQAGATDAALNAGGESIYIWVGLRRYRLFLKTPVEIDHGKQYVVEGVYAQKVIDDIGDPDNGRNGYPLLASAERAVKRAWPSLSMDGLDATVSLVRARLKRYPARPLFLVTKIRPATDEETAAAPPEAAKAGPEVEVAPEKQRALLVEGSAVQPAPLWEPKAEPSAAKSSSPPMAKSMSSPPASSSVKPSRGRPSAINPPSRAANPSAWIPKWKSASSRERRNGLAFCRLGG